MKTAFYLYTFDNGANLFQIRKPDEVLAGDVTKNYEVKFEIGNTDQREIVGILQVVGPRYGYDGRIKADAFLMLREHNVTEADVEGIHEFKIQREVSESDVIAFARPDHKGR